MGPHDDVLNKAFGDLPVPKFKSSGESGRREVDARWEHRCVGILLKHYGLTRLSPEMTRLSKDMTGRGVLTFGALKLLQPTFPLTLGFGKIPNLHHGKLVEAFCLPTKMTKRKTAAGDAEAAVKDSKSWIYKAFESAEANLSAAGPFGFVFEFVYSQSGPQMIAHNYHGPTRRPEVDSVRLVYDLPKADQTVTVMNYELFLETLVWSPDE